MTGLKAATSKDSKSFERQTKVANNYSQIFEIQRPKIKKEGLMYGVVQFMRSLVMAALLLGAAGTLVEATGIVGYEAAKAHQRGGIKFKWLNQQLVGGGK